MILLEFPSSDGLRIIHRKCAVDTCSPRGRGHVIDFQARRRARQAPAAMKPTIARVCGSGT